LTVAERSIKAQPSDPLGRLREQEGSVHKKMLVFTVGIDHKTRFGRANGWREAVEEGRGRVGEGGDGRRICGVSYVQKQVHIIQKMYQTEIWNEYDRAGVVAENR